MSSFKSLKDILKRNFYLKILILISSLGIFLRIYHLGFHSFWCDEFLAIFLGKHSLSWMVNYITYKDAHPPLIYFLAHFVLKIGDSEFLLRLIPAFFGVLCIPASYFLGKEVFGEKVGILFATFLALNPAHILWSQTLKSYTLFTLLLLISLYSFYRLVFYEKKGLWLALFFVNITLLYLHNFAFMVILIEGLYLILEKKLNKKWIFYHVLLLIAYIPWLIRIPYQLSFTLGVRRPISWSYKFLYNFFYFFLGETVHPFYFPFVIPALLVFTFLFILGFVNLKNIERRKRTLLLIGLLLPLLLIPFPSTVPQNLIPFSIFWYLLLALGIMNLKIKMISTFLVIFFFSFSTFFYYTGNIYHYHDVSKLVPYREIGNFLRENTTFEDIILTNEKRQFIDKKPLSAFDWYYKGEAKILEARRDDFISEDLKNLLKGYNRVWVFLNFNEKPDWCEELKGYLNQNYSKVLEKKYLWNERILQRLKKTQEGERYYYFIEIYLFEKK